MSQVPLLRSVVRSSDRVDDAGAVGDDGGGRGRLRSDARFCVVCGRGRLRWIRCRLRHLQNAAVLRRRCAEPPTLFPPPPRDRRDTLPLHCSWPERCTRCVAHAAVRDGRPTAPRKKEFGCSLGAHDHLKIPSCTLSSERLLKLKQTVQSRCAPPLSHITCRPGRCRCRGRPRSRGAWSGRPRGGATRRARRP